MMRLTACIVAIILSACMAVCTLAAEPVQLREDAPANTEYRVITEFSFSGELLLPIEQGKPPQKVNTTGKSSIDYAELILKVDPKEADHKSLRVYEKIDFVKTTGDRTDKLSLRESVRRVVMMKRGPTKVPFAPEGPLKWGEIEMLRTDFYVPALAGLLPEKPVNEGDRWTASETAVRELTDLEKLDRGTLDCYLDKLESVGPRRVAHISFAGTLVGVNEDGPTRQKLTGKIILDVAAKCLSYLKIDGTQDLLDEKGGSVGQIRGTFQMTRAAISGHSALKAETIAKLELSPSEGNTQLLVDGDPKGIKFIHPRRWHVGRSTGRQITMDESGGAGLLITLDTLRNTPSVNEYQREALRELLSRGAKLSGRSVPTSLATGIDTFSFDVATDKETFKMVYFTIRQTNGGATIAARIPDRDKTDRIKEVEAIVRSFMITERIDGK